MNFRFSLSFHSLAELQYTHTTLAMTQSTVDFSYLQSTLSLDQEIREQIRESTKLIDTTQRPLIALLSRVHSTPASQRTLSPSSPSQTLSLKFTFHPLSRSSTITTIPLSPLATPTSILEISRRFDPTTTVLQIFRFLLEVDSTILIHHRFEGILDEYGRTS